MNPNRHQTSAFSTAERCSGDACKRLLRGALDTVRSLQVLVDKLGDKQEQRVVQTKEYLEAMETLRSTYIEHNQPLEDRDIRPLSKRTGGVNLVPENQPTAQTYPESQWTEGVNLATADPPMVRANTQTRNFAPDVEMTIPSHTESKPTGP